MAGFVADWIAGRLRCCQNALRIGSTRAILSGGRCVRGCTWSFRDLGLTASIRQQPAGLRVTFGEMLKLCVYGCLNRVQSSQRLEHEARRDLEVMWLTGGWFPDHKTIADFRKDNGPAIKKVCARFIALCRDGPAAKPQRCHRRRQVRGRKTCMTITSRRARSSAARSRSKTVARYMSQLDAADRQTAEGEEPSERCSSLGRGLRKSFRSLKKK